MTERNPRLKLQLRCPRCNSTSIQHRLKTNERICRRCGYAGSPEEFEIKPKTK